MRRQSVRDSRRNRRRKKNKKKREVINKSVSQIMTRQTEEQRDKHSLTLDAETNEAEKQPNILKVSYGK